MAKTIAFRVTDYTDPGAGKYIGTVRAATWSEANAKAQSKWPRRVLHIGR